jgi:hypothetical protein
VKVVIHPEPRRVSRALDKRPNQRLINNLYLGHQFMMGRSAIAAQVLINNSYQPGIDCRERKISMLRLSARAI